MRFVNFGSLNIDYTFIVDKIVCAGQTISSLSEQRVSGRKGIESESGSGPEPAVRFIMQVRSVTMDYF